MSEPERPKAAGGWMLSFLLDIALLPFKLVVGAVRGVVGGITRRIP